MQSENTAKKLGRMRADLLTGNHLQRTINKKGEWEAHGKFQIQYSFEKIDF